jgi:hypothetical protein
MAGGCLVFGAIRRLFDRPRVSCGLLLGLGAIILANSRPFEGLLACGVAFGFVFWWLFKTDALPLTEKIRRVGLPCAGVVALGAGWMMFYNFRVTGSPFLLPYQVYEATYAYVPTWPWSDVRPVPPKCTGVFYGLQQWALHAYRENQTVEGVLDNRWWHFRYNLLFYFRFCFLIPLLFLPRILRDRWILGIALALLFVSLGVFQSNLPMPRKLAPVACLLVLVMVSAWKAMYGVTWRGRALGKVLAWTVPLVCLVSLAASFHPYFQGNGWSHARDHADLSAALEGKAGKHLVIVAYGNKHNLHTDWISNKADIDGSKVVWARSLGLEKDRQLEGYFHDRQIWKLRIGFGAPGQIDLIPCWKFPEAPACVSGGSAGAPQRL